MFNGIRIQKSPELVSQETRRLTLYFFSIVLFWFDSAVASWFPLICVKFFTIFVFCGVSSGYAWNLSASAETSSFESPIYTVSILSLAFLSLIRGLEPPIISILNPTEKVSHMRFNRSACRVAESCFIYQLPSMFNDISRPIHLKRRFK